MSKELITQEELEFRTDLEFSSTTNPTITEQKQVREWVLNLQKFIKLLEKPLENQKIKLFQQGKTSFKYVPIDVIETQVKKLFMGLVKEHEPKWQVIGNEIVATQKFDVFHPVAGVWVSVVGWAAVQIRMKQNTDKSDPSNKITNALQMDFPHLASEVYKNAFQKFGRQFGRGLRRDYLDEYQELLKDLTPISKEQSVNDKKLFEEFTEKVDEFPGAEPLEAQAYKIVEDAKKRKMNEVDVALLQNHINNKIKELRGAK